MAGPNDQPASSNVNYDEVVNARIAPIQDVNPYSCDSDSVGAAVRHYDAELKSLAQTQAALATRRNAVVQNSRIPPEILSRIFKEVIDLHPTTHDGPPHHERIPPEYPMLAELPMIPQSLPGWLPLSQVCRRWRDVLFQDQRVWTEITYATSLAWLKECLSRAGDLPVTLHRYIPYGYSPWQRNLAEFNTINEHLFHIRELVVLMNPGSMVYAVPLTNPAPCLESLTLSRYRIGIPGEPREDPDYEPVVDPLSNELLAGTAPALRKLVLSGFTLSWVLSPLITPSITHFELRFPPFAVVQNMDMPDEPDATDPLTEPLRAQLFLCLQRMPMLEVLKLENCWPVSSIDDPWPPRHRWPVFAHLRSLTVAGDMMSCAEFLEHVTIPTSASVSVVCSVAKRDIQDDDLDVEELLSVVPAYIRRLSTGRRISAAALEISTSAGGSGIKLWRSKAGDPLVDEGEPFVTVLFNSKPTPLAQAVLPMLRKLIRTLQLSDARLLSLSCRFSEMRRIRLVKATKELIKQLLGRCTRIEHLVFNMRAVDILSQLMEAVDGAPPGSPGGAENGNHPDVSRFFRELATISLLDTKSAEPSGNFEPKLSTHSPFPDAKFFEAFTPHLVALRQEGHLQVLNVPWEDVEDWKSQFRGMVPVRPMPIEVQKYMDWQ